MWIRTWLASQQHRPHRSACCSHSFHWVISTNCCDTSLKGEFHRTGDTLGCLSCFDALWLQRLVLLTLMTIFFLPIPSLFLFQSKVLFNPYASPQSRFINQEANFLKANPSDLSGIVSCPHFYKSLGLMGASEFSLSEPSLCRALSSHITYKVYFTSASMLPSSAPSSASKCKGIVACNRCLSSRTVF